MDNNFSNILGIFKRLDEGTMASAEKEKTGPAFTGYWAGTDAGTPGKHMVGAGESVEPECDAPMSLADKLRARWEETKKQKGLMEFGADATSNAGTGGAGGGIASAGATTAATPPDPKEIAKDQSIVSALKGAGVPIASTGAMVKTLNKQPGQPGDPQDMKNLATLGGAMKTVIDQGDPNFAKGPLAQAVKRAMTAGGAQ
jgi:hypothetical protein